MMKSVLFTGMRRGELFKLKWEQINFDDNWIFIKDPKGGLDQKIPLNDLAKELLLNHPRTKGTRYVFPGIDGKRRVTAAIASRRIRDKAGLPKTFRPFHGLRHAYASMLAMSGNVTIFELQKLMTHKDIRMTMRYSHLLDDNLRKASNTVNDIFADSSNPKITVKHLK